MRPIIVGMNNPYRYDGKYALHPHPPGCSGWRLWKMLHDRCGISKGDYAKKFDLRNLASHGTRFKKGATVVLLGEEVRRAVGVPRLLIHPQIKNGVTYRQIPHPSGRSTAYNDPAMRALAGMLLEDLL